MESLKEELPIRLKAYTGIKEWLEPLGDEIEEIQTY